MINTFHVNAPKSARDAIVSHAKTLGYSEYGKENPDENSFISFNKKKSHYWYSGGMGKLITLEEFFSLKPELKFEPKQGEFYKYKDGTVYVLGRVDDFKFSLISLFDGNRYSDMKGTLIGAFGGKEKEFVKVKKQLKFTDF